MDQEPTVSQSRSSMFAFQQSIHSHWKSLDKIIWLHQAIDEPKSIEMFDQGTRRHLPVSLARMDGPGGAGFLHGPPPWSSFPWKFLAITHNRHSNQAPTRKHRRPNHQDPTFAFKLVQRRFSAVLSIMAFCAFDALPTSQEHLTPHYDIPSFENQYIVGYRHLSRQGKIKQSCPRRNFQEDRHWSGQTCTSAATLRSSLGINSRQRRVRQHPSSSMHSIYTQ
jgi:hypothetical protein